MFAACRLIPSPPALVERIKKVAQEAKLTSGEMGKLLTAIDKIKQQQAIVLPKFLFCFIL
jgi:uncharacterized coiled-coil DUF342 family protein